MNKRTMAVHEVAALTGITARTLHYYDEIDLLKPSIITKAKYRQYTDEDLSKLQEILFFREVGFALKEIKELLNTPNYNRTDVLNKHLVILEAQKERINALIALVKKEIEGAKELTFSAFSVGKIQKHSKSLKLYFLHKQKKSKMNKWRTFIQRHKVFLKSCLCMKMILLIARKYSQSYANGNNIFLNIFMSVMSKFYLIWVFYILLMKDLQIL